MARIVREALRIHIGGAPCTATLSGAAPTWSASSQRLCRDDRSPAFPGGEVDVAEMGDDGHESPRAARLCPNRGAAPGEDPIRHRWPSPAPPRTARARP